MIGRKSVIIRIVGVRTVNGYMSGYALSRSRNALGSRDHRAGIVALTKMVEGGTTKSNRWSRIHLAECKRKASLNALIVRGSNGNFEIWFVCRLVASALKSDFCELLS